jgi:hypothetical protein
MNTVPAPLSLPSLRHLPFLRPRLLPRAPARPGAAASMQIERDVGRCHPRRTTALPPRAHCRHDVIHQNGPFSSFWPASLSVTDPNLDDTTFSMSTNVNLFAPPSAHPLSCSPQETPSRWLNVARLVWGSVPVCARLPACSRPEVAPMWGRCGAPRRHHLRRCRWPLAVVGRPSSVVASRPTPENVQMWGNVGVSPKSSSAVRPFLSPFYFSLSHSLRNR